jgi:hypothetical protein
MYVDWAHLCLGLSAADGKRLVSLAENLQAIADLTGADAFLDRITGENTAIVTAQAQPDTGVSAYAANIVGIEAYAENEPAVFRAFYTKMAIRDIRAVTQ